MRSTRSLDRKGVMATATHFLEASILLDQIIALINHDGPWICAAGGGEDIV